jgi:hypothetical protein
VLYKHIDGVDVKAHFSEDLQYRYTLVISLKAPERREKTACVVMQNPSCAGEDRADKSVQFMEKVVFQKKFPQFAEVRRLIVVNQYAKVQTNGFKGEPDSIGDVNDSAIETALRESDIIILGWGSGNPFRERQAFVLGLLTRMNGKLLLKTKMHPSRGRYAGFIQPFGD